MEDGEWENLDTESSDASEEQENMEEDEDWGKEME